MEEKEEEDEEDEEGKASPARSAQHSAAALPTRPEKQIRASKRVPRLDEGPGPAPSLGECEQHNVGQLAGAPALPAAGRKPRAETNKRQAPRSGAWPSGPLRLLTS